MSVETLVFSALKPLVSNRVYTPIAPPTATTLPRITFQQVGGAAVNFFEGNVPSKKNCRMQVNVWHSEPQAAMALMREVEDTLRPASGLQATVLGAAVQIYEPDTKLHGAMQDFSLWFDD